jgi:hypothetical protein
MNENRWMANAQQSESMNPEAQADFSLLMSLALDELLDEEDTQRFHGYLSHHTGCAYQWRQWQQLDRLLEAAPHMEPPSDFAQRVAWRLAQQERKRQLWWATAVGLLFVLLCIGAVSGMVALGLYLVLNQPHWLGGLIHTLAYSGATVQHWLATAGLTLNTLLSSPEVLGLGAAYLLVAVVLIAYWVRFLRRTTRSEEGISLIIPL